MYIVWLFLIISYQAMDLTCSRSIKIRLFIAFWLNRPIFNCQKIWFIFRLRWRQSINIFDFYSFFSPWFWVHNAIVLLKFRRIFVPRIHNCNKIAFNVTFEQLSKIGRWTLVTWNTFPWTERSFPHIQAHIWFKIKKMQ